jgi:hypothetical protein
MLLELSLQFGQPQLSIKGSIAIKSRNRKGFPAIPHIVEWFM